MRGCTSFLLFISVTLVTGLKASNQVNWRPYFVAERLAKRETMHYFGLGSNMLRSKIVNRGMNKSKIEILEMEPAYVQNHRLAFNMRGSAPLEPGMGSLEPLESTSEPQLSYHRPECHGALITLTAENYEKVMASEGVSFTQSRSGRGYEEIVVTAIPYNTSKPAVQAVALRARPKSRLRRDPCPSERYMSLLRDGAKELDLRPDYQAFLQQHPVQHVPKWLKRVAIQNHIATSMTSSVLKWRELSRWQRRILFRVYVPSTAHAVRRNLSHVATLGLLIPGAVVGSLIQLFFKVSQRSPPPFVTRLVMSDNAAASTSSRTVTNTTDKTSPISAARKS